MLIREEEKDSQGGNDLISKCYKAYLNIHKESSCRQKKREGGETLMTKKGEEDGEKEQFGLCTFDMRIREAYQLKPNLHEHQMVAADYRPVVTLIRD